MALKLFGFEFSFNKRSSNAPAQTSQPTSTTISPVPPNDYDGAVNVQYGAGGGFFGYYLDLDGAVVDDFSLINRYREMQLVAEIDEAIDQIVNEMVVQDEDRSPVSLNLDRVDAITDKIKIRIQAEFDHLLKLLKFHRDAYTIVRQWYIDGRLYFHLLVDEQKPENGVQELRLVDPRTIRKIREVQRKRHQESQADIIETVREFYAFNPMGFIGPNTSGGVQTATSGPMVQYNGIPITVESIAFCPSGLYDSSRRTVLSWLHKAIKPLNLLRMMEDSCVIYRIARAPERRVFYIDVGNLPKQKAEEYLHAIMLKYRNKLVYDVNTGEIRDDRKFMSVMEDFWLPRKEGGKGTEIQTLPAGQNLSEMEDVEYFRKKLFRALSIPPSRFEQGTGFSLGRTTEITRDELRFLKFIKRLQVQFNTLFDQLLERQLRLKNVLTEREWNGIKDNIRYIWQQDSHFEELKNQDIWNSRLAILSQVDPFENKYFSRKQIARDILKYTEEEWTTIREEFNEDVPDFIPGTPQTDTAINFDQFDQQADDILAPKNENMPPGDAAPKKETKATKDDDEPDDDNTSAPSFKKKPFTAK